MYILQIKYLFNDSVLINLTMNIGASSPPNKIALSLRFIPPVCLVTSLNTWML